MSRGHQAMNRLMGLMLPAARASGPWHQVIEPDA
jgi:hypothetical protein